VTSVAQWLRLTHPPSLVDEWRCHMFSLPDRDVRWKYYNSGLCLEPMINDFFFLAKILFHGTALVSLTLLRPVNRRCSKTIVWNYIAISIDLLLRTFLKNTERVLLD
jgi:hypothetical protein